MDKLIVLLKVKKVDDTIAGTIKKIVKEFVPGPGGYRAPKQRKEVVKANKTFLFLQNRLKLLWYRFFNKPKI